MVFAATIIAVALSAYPSQSPQEPRISKSHSAQSAGNPENSDKTETPSKTLPQPTPSTSQPAAQTTKPNTSTDADNMKIQTRIEIFTGVLACVGVLQFVVMFLTLLVYRRQAGIMEQQRATMQSQGTTMQGQLTQMEAAGKQTDRLLAESAKGADAAKRSADMLVVSERALIQVVIKKISSERPMPNKIGFVWVWPDFVNHGRTPARITNIVVRPHRIPKGDDPQVPPRLPPEPEYNSPQTTGIERDAMLPPTSGITPLPVAISASDFMAAKQRDVFTYIYGFVDYFDIAGEARQTRFCELYWVPYGIGDPQQEGFVTAGDTPPAYTRST